MHHRKHRFCTSAKNDHFTFLACHTTVDSTITIDNETLRIPEPRKKCVFPFKYRNKIFHECTNYDCHDENLYWCGTQYNASFYFGWGKCNDACPKANYDYGNNGISLLQFNTV